VDLMEIIISQQIIAEGWAYCGHWNITLVL
jgi:hypothetical protein